MPPTGRMDLQLRYRIIQYTPTSGTCGVSVGRCTVVFASALAVFHSSSRLSNVAYTSRRPEPALTCLVLASQSVRPIFVYLLGLSPFEVEKRLATTLYSSTYIKTV